MEQSTWQLTFYDTARMENQVYMGKKIENEVDRTLVSKV